MNLPFSPPIEPMLAQLQEEIPEGEALSYEPKWDGFRAIIFQDEGTTHLNSRNGQPLQRYFPELVEALRQRLPPRCIVDGEIIIAGATGLDFDALQLRLHPAESRVRKLAAETPASFVAFDLLALGDEDLRALPFSLRRQRLAGAIVASPQVFVTPLTSKPDEARQWFTRYEGAGMDGVVAKRAEVPYLPGERAMVKVKHARTADCVVGGYRLAKTGDGVASLLLGLYDADGVLHHVGHTSSFKAKQKRELLAEFKQLGGDSFGQGRTPGAPSRWSNGKDLSWFPVRPERVCEVSFDHLQGQRFRHAATFLRWRTDRDPSSCSYAQVEPPHPFSLEDVLGL